MLELVKLVPLALDCSDDDKETLMILFVSNILYVISNLIFFYNLNHRLILRQCLILLKGIKIAEAYSLFSLNSQRIGSY